MELSYCIQVYCMKKGECYHHLTSNYMSLDREIALSLYKCSSNDEMLSERLFFFLGRWMLVMEFTAAWMFSEFRWKYFCCLVQIWKNPHQICAKHLNCVGLGSFCKHSLAVVFAHMQASMALPLTQAGRTCAGIRLTGAWSSGRLCSRWWLWIHLLVFCVLFLFLYLLSSPAVSDLAS